MRVSSNTLFDSNVAAMTQQQARLLQTQQQIATGRKILTASDNPVAAARALEVTQSDAMNTQYATNRGAARHTLSLAESTLQGVTSLLQDVKTATVNAGSGVMNSSDRRTMATELSGRLQELLGLANSTDGTGNYLFAGFQSKAQPFVNTAAGMAYFGDDGQRNVQVSATRQMPSSGNGADIFMRIRSGNGSLLAQASAANTGGGIVSTAVVSDPALLTGDSYTISYNGPAAAASPGNAGTGVIGAPTVVDAAAVTGLDYKVAFNTIATQAAAGNTGTIATPATVLTPASVTGHNYSITNTGVGTYTVQDLTLGAPVAPVVTPGAPDTVAFDGIQVAITGALATEVFNVLAPTYNVTELPAGRNTQAITSLDFTVPGTFVVDAAGDNDLVTLTGVYANEAAVVAKIQADLDVDAAGAFTVTSKGTVVAANFSVTIERVSTGAASAAVAVSAADAGATANGIANSAGTAGGASVLTNQPYVSGQAFSFAGLQFNIQGIPNPTDSFTVSSPGYTVTNNTTLATTPATGRTLYVANQPANFSFDGIRLDIQGAPVNGDTFTVSPSTNESIFKTISDLIAALNAPVVGASLTNSLNRGLNHLDNALNNVLTTRSSLGLRLNEIDALQAAGDDLGLQYKQTLSELQDVDYNQAISDLVRQQTNLQAAQQTFSKVAGLSLFNYI